MTLVVLTPAAPLAPQGQGRSLAQVGVRIGSRHGHGGACRLPGAEGHEQGGQVVQVAAEAVQRSAEMVRGRHRRTTQRPREATARRPAPISSSM
jgi:hypothetical protein